jgi:hypothetical protein
MKVLFPDTNLFLQCRALTELPWEEIARGDDLLLLVSRPVQDEIDALKSDRKQRRAKRARRASSFIRKIIVSPDSKLVIRDSGPRVEISLSPQRKVASDLPDALDLSRIDDRIIAEAISYKKNTGENVAILTHDTNSLATAKYCSLDSIVIPDEWLLPPEPDDRDKRIQELERILKEYAKNYPEIEIINKNQQGNAITSLALSIVSYNNLTNPQLYQLITETQAKFPMITKFHESEGSLADLKYKSALGKQYKPATKQEIQRYQEEEYPNWLKKVRALFTSLPTLLEYPHRQVTLSVGMYNQGTVPAEHLTVEFRLTNGLQFKPPPDKNDEPYQDSILRLPPPPKPPMGKWISLFDEFAKIGQLTAFTSSPFRNAIVPALMPKPRDKHLFYWKPSKPREYTDSWTLECEEFRHQVEPWIFDIMLYVPQTVTKGVLKCRVTAKNLPKPFRSFLPIEITYTPGDILEKARGLLQKCRF